MKNKFCAIIFVAIALSLLSCAPQVGQTFSRTTSGLEPAAPPAPIAPEAAAKDAVGRTVSPNASSAASAERMIVRTVSLGLEVQDSEKSFDVIASIATKYKGYVSNTNSRRDSKNRLIGTITLRIPAESLDNALKEMKTASLKVLTENSNANDVTDQYTDLNARQKNLEATEAELTKLLATVRERTGKAEDILAVYNRLTEIRGQIEQIKGQINVIDRTTALATVTVQLTPHDDVQILEPDTWAPNRTAAEALRALIQTLQFFGTVAIWMLIYVIPLFVLPLLVFIWVVRVWLRRR